MHDYLPNETPNETPLVVNIPKQTTINNNYPNSILLNSYSRINTIPNTQQMNFTVPRNVKTVRFFDKVENFPDVELNENYQSIGLDDPNLYSPINLNEREGKHSYASPSFQYVFIKKLLSAHLINKSDAVFLYNMHKSSKDKIIFLTDLMNSCDISINTGITEDEINTMLLYWRSRIPIIKNSNQGEYAFQYELSNYIQTLNEAEIEFNITSLVQNYLLQGRTGIEDFRKTKDLRLTLGILCDMRSDICERYPEYLEEAINDPNIYFVIYPLYSHILNLYSCLLREHIASSSVIQNFQEIALIIRSNQNFNSDELNILGKKLNHLKRTALWFKSSYSVLIHINPGPDAMLNDILIFVDKALDMLKIPKTKTIK